MKIFTYLFLLVVFSILIAGCEGGGNDSKGAAPKTPFIGGTKGLEMEFLEGSPPEEVTDSGTFDFQAVVSIKNEGEFDLKQDQVKVDLIGFLPEDFGSSTEELNDKRPEDDPSPKRRDSEGNLIDPGETFVTFPSDEGFFDFERSVTGNTPFIFRADVCYKYQTKALSRICVLRDLINKDNDAICDPSETKKVFSSSSPLQISSFRQTIAGQDKISFSFDVVHSGDGSIFKEGDASSPAADCPREPRESREKENRVLVTVDTKLPNLKCVGLEGATTGYITLVDNKRAVTCTQELDPGRNDFETNVDITLDFNYQDKVEQDVLVKHLVENS